MNQSMWSATEGENDEAATWEKNLMYKQQTSDPRDTYAITVASRLSNTYHRDILCPLPCFEEVILVHNSSVSQPMVPGLTSLCWHLTSESLLARSQIC